MVAVFVDLDGVIVDFVKGALAHHNRADFLYDDVRWNFHDQIGVAPADFWNPLGHEFWASLEPYNDGFSLLTSLEKLVGVEHIGLLSSPCDTVGCAEGKREWVTKHLPAYRKRLFLGSAKELFAGPTKVLIDDHDGNVDKFAAAGGLTVTPPRPWNRRAHECKRGGGFCPDSLFPEVEHAVHTAILRTHPKA